MQGRSWFFALLAAIPVLLLAVPLPAQEESPSLEFTMRVRDGKLEGNLECSLHAVDINPQERDSLLFRVVGSSKLVGRFQLPLAPCRAVLQLEHLSSSASVELGGRSPVTISFNGSLLARDWDPGSHGFRTAQLHVTKYLRQGDNRIEILFGQGSTGYWLKRVRILCHFPAGTELSGEVVRLPPGKRADYAVIVSRATYENEEWKPVVEALQQKHEGVALVYPFAVQGVREELCRVYPRQACFVARPSECTREFVVAINRLTRALDEDPYGDCLWGILTGYEAADALRLARHATPLRVRRVAAGCGVSLELFREGVWYSECEKNVMWEKTPGQKPEKKKCPDDTTALLVAELNANAPDLFITSGHATERDWQLGYSYRNGQFRCESGQLFGLDLAGKRYDIRSPNPKVYSASGNCLMGHIPDRNVMALAWMRSGGVHQMVAYTVSTWFGYAGWGAQRYFLRHAGRYTYAEAFYVNNQALIHRLESEYSATARAAIDEFGLESDAGLLGRLAAQLGVSDQDNLGLLWDRDTVAFYGDPAWEARLEAEQAPPYELTLRTERSKLVLRYTLQLEALSEGTWARPPVALLPDRIAEPRVREGSEHSPVVTENFILVPCAGEFSKGDTIRIVVVGRPL